MRKHENLLILVNFRTRSVEFENIKVTHLECMSGCIQFWQLIILTVTRLSVNNFNRVKTLTLGFCVITLYLNNLELAIAIADNNFHCHSVYNLSYSGVWIMHIMKGASANVKWHKFGENWASFRYKYLFKLFFYWWNFYYPRNFAFSWYY